MVESLNKRPSQVAEAVLSPDEEQQHVLAYATLEALSQRPDHLRNHWKVGTLRQAVAVLQQEHAQPNLTLETLTEFLTHHDLYISLQELDNTSLKGGVVKQVTSKTVTFGGHQTSVDQQVLFSIGPVLEPPGYADDWRTKVAANNKE